MLDIRRRQFMTLLGGTAAWPLAARAQQVERMRRIGVLMNTAAEDPEGQARNTAFVQALQQLGWTDDRNVRIETRWGTDAGSTRKYAAELVALAPDVILASSSTATSALQQTTRTVPIVFVTVIDPVGAGYVESLARPGGNLTGYETAITPTCKDRIAAYGVKTVLFGALLILTGCTREEATAVTFRSMSSKSSMPDFHADHLTCISLATDFELA
jgi:hypothetical protein